MPTDIKPYQILVAHLMPSTEAYAPKKETQRPRVVMHNHKKEKIGFKGADKGKGKSNAKLTVADLLSTTGAVTSKNASTNFAPKWFNEFMAIVVASIEHTGWVSAKVVDAKSMRPTAIMAWDNLFFHASAKNTLVVRKDHEKLAERAVKWCANLTDKEICQSDYLTRIRWIARGRYLSIDTYKHAASIVNAYNKMVLEAVKKDVDGYAG